MIGEILHQLAPAAAAEAVHPVLHVRDEALASLLTVVTDVDPCATWAAIVSAAARSIASRNSPGSTGSPRLRRPCNSASAGFLGRLPAWVVRIRDSLVSMARFFPSSATHAFVGGLAPSLVG